MKGRTVYDAALELPSGETVYEVNLDEATVEALIDGICPEALSVRMHGLLAWRREQQRVAALNRAATKNVRRR